MNRIPIELNPLWVATALVILFSFCGGRDPVPSISATQVEPYIEAELLRLEETYRILDRYSEALWPDWKRGFLEKGKDLDVMMADLLRLTSAEKEEIAHRLSARYGDDEPF